MTDSNGSVRITLADVHDKLEEVSKQVANLAVLATTVSDHETRIRKTERYVFMALGVAVASPVIVVLVLA